MQISCPKCGKKHEISGMAVEQMLGTKVRCDCGQSWHFPEDFPFLNTAYILVLSFRNNEGCVIPEKYFEEKFRISGESADKLKKRFQERGILSKTPGRSVLLRSPMFYETASILSPDLFEVKASPAPLKLEKKILFVYGMILLQLIFILWLICGAPIPFLQNREEPEQEQSVISRNHFPGIPEYRPDK